MLRGPIRPCGRIGQHKGISLGLDEGAYLRVAFSSLGAIESTCDRSRMEFLSTSKTLLVLAGDCAVIDLSLLEGTSAGGGNGAGLRATTDVVPVKR